MHGLILKDWIQKVRKLKDIPPIEIRTVSRSLFFIIIQKDCNRLILE